MKPRLLVLLLTFAFYTMKGQVDSSRLAQSAIEITKLDSLPDQLYQSLSSFKLIMIGEMHGTKEPAAFVKGLAQLFTKYNDSVLVGFEIPSTEMREFLKEKTERAVFNSAFFTEPSRDGRASEAWAGCISAIAQNPKAKIFFYDVNSGESKNKNLDRDSLMYVKIKHELKKHPSYKVITLSGNIHNMLLPYKGEKKVGAYLSGDKELNLTDKICSMNHMYKSGTMLNNMGKGLALNKVDNGNTEYSKFTKYKNYVFLFFNSKQYAYTGTFFTRAVTAATLISAGPQKYELKETFNEDDTPYTNDLKDKLKPIQENFKRINSISDWDTIHKKILSPSTRVRFYYAGKRIERLTVREGQGIDQTLTEYYLSKGQLSFVYEKCFDKTVVVDSEKPTIIETKNYFEKGKLIHIHHSQDRDIPFREAAILEHEKKVKDQFEQLLKLK